MKAIRGHDFGGPEVLRLEEIATPEPGPGEVLVRVRAIGVNPVETYLRSGSNPNLPRPYTPGTDCAGEIEAVGEGIMALQPGDRVYTAATITGAYAEQTLCRESAVHLLPEAVSFEEGAALNIPYATAWRALHQRGQGRRGETVLIHGASGGVGLAATQIAHHMGLVVIGTAGTEQGRTLVARHGAHHVVDHTKDGYLDDIRALTNGAGPDLILEMLSNVNLGHDAQLIAPRGRIVVIGSRGTVVINPRDLMTREADVRGLMLFNATASELADIHAGLRDGMEKRYIQPVIGRTLPLADAAEAHKAVLAPGAFGKIVLKP